MKLAINWLYWKFKPDAREYAAQIPEITEYPPRTDDCQEMVMLEWCSANWIECACLA
jgi:hypothetical protein